MVRDKPAGECYRGVVRSRFTLLSAKHSLGFGSVDGRLPFVRKDRCMVAEASGRKHQRE